MLVGEYSSCLTRFFSTGGFGTEELDEHFKPLDARLNEFGVDVPGRIFYLLLSFLLNQLTEWDACATAYGDGGALYAALSHARHLLIPSDVSGATIVLRKPPIRHRVIELRPEFLAAADLAVVRAPATCLLAFMDGDDLLRQAESLREQRRAGQAYAFLVRLDLAAVDTWLATFQTQFDPFLTALWLNALDGAGGTAVIALFTTDMPAHEI